jgi:hypothetical protein
MDDFCISPGLLRLLRGNPRLGTRRRVRGTVSTPALTPLLVASRREAWPGVTGPRSHLRIGVGVIGAGVGTSVLAALTRGSEPGGLSHLNTLGGDP